MSTGEYRKRVAGTPYRPSNGSEGCVFEGHFCDRCEKQAAFRRAEDAGRDPSRHDCRILVAAHINDEDDPDYPKEWVHDAEGFPTCTAFEPERPREKRHREPTRYHSTDRDQLTLTFSAPF